jgi:hypothetical protein
MSRSYPLSRSLTRSLACLGSYALITAEDPRHG